MSYSTVWRRLDEDALRPWFHRPWLFPRTRTCSLKPPTPCLSATQRGEQTPSELLGGGGAGERVPSQGPAQPAAESVELILNDAERRDTPL